MKHLVVNFITIAVFIAGIFFYFNTKKEEYPDTTFDFLRISVNYPGAPAIDVERLVTEPMEEMLVSLDGVYSVESTSSSGSSNISVELEPGLPDREAVISEIRNAVLDVRLPDEVEEDPRVRVFETSRKSILNIGVYFEGKRLLDYESRKELQKYVRTLETRLTSRREIHSVSRRGYENEEIEISARPGDLRRYNISFDKAMGEVRSNHIRQPAGALEDGDESKVSLRAELDEPEALKNLVVQGGFEGHGVRLEKLADIRFKHTRPSSITKINGHEGVALNVVKASSAGILEALEIVKEVRTEFERSTLKGTPIRLVLMDDESTDLRNRLAIIGVNGLIGFALIMVLLFMFLDFKSGLWVGVGIPFTFCFSIIVFYLLGFTINNVTLAGVIIVMGMVVDDAIIVAENMHRASLGKGNRIEKALAGAVEVVGPVVAAVLTTCAAFVPLAYMEGHRWLQMFTIIPAVVIIMLGSSLVESLFILPAHLTMVWKPLDRLSDWLHSWGRSYPEGEDWFTPVEKKYEAWVYKALGHRNKVLSVFIILGLVSAYLAGEKMKFVMFPREETREIAVTLEGPVDMKRYDMARLIESVEDIMLAEGDKLVVGVSSNVAQGRRGGAAQENYARITAEIVPKEERHESADAIVARWKEKTDALKGFEKIDFAKSRWGSGSGSPVEVVVRGNNDQERLAVADAVRTALEGYDPIKSAELDKDREVPEFRIRLKRDVIKRLSISPSTVASTMRAALQGTSLYEIRGGDEEIKVRFTVEESYRKSIDQLLKVPVENQRGYLVPLGEVLLVEKVPSAIAITRRQGLRITRVDANIKTDLDMEAELKGQVPGAKGEMQDKNKMRKAPPEIGSKQGKPLATPVEIAEWLEAEVFPPLLAGYPTVTLSFDGEIKDTRESKGMMWKALGVVLALIFGILAVLFNSVSKPLLIMTAIPFGAVGVILAFLAQGINEFGLFASIGALGMAGVVVNDAIVMVFKMEQALDSHSGRDLNASLADAAQSRLKAVILTTATTVAGLLPTAYGLAGYDAMLAQMMMAMAWGLMFGTTITLYLVPCLVSFSMKKKKNSGAQA